MQPRTAGSLRRATISAYQSDGCPTLIARRVAFMYRTSGRRRLPASQRRFPSKPCSARALARAGARTGTGAVFMSKPTTRLGCVPILWRGDAAARRSVTAESSRFKAVFAALAEAGIDAEPVVYEDDVLDAVRAQLG